MSMAGGQPARGFEFVTAVLFAATLVLGAATVGRPVLFPGSMRWLREAETAFVQDRFADAERLALEHIRLGERQVRTSAAAGADAAFVASVADAWRMADAWTLAGEAARKLQANERSIRHFRQVPVEHPRAGNRAAYGLGNRWLRDGRLRDAEPLLRQVLARQPDHPEAARDLAYLLQVQGRAYESLQPLGVLLRAGLAGGDHLLMAGSTDSVALREQAFVDRCLATVPDDPRPLLSRASAAFRDQDHATARRLLDSVLAADPLLAEAQAKLGRLLLDQGDDHGFLEWHRALPSALPPHPDLWVNRGLWSRRRSEHEAAARCFAEALTLQPHHATATHHLSLTLEELGERAAARELAERARRLNRIEYALRDIGEGADIFRRIAVDLESLGRTVEAAAWYHVLLEWRQPPPWAAAEFARLATQSPATGPPFDATRYPLPRIDRDDMGQAPAGTIAGGVRPAGGGVEPNIGAAASAGSRRVSRQVAGVDGGSQAGSRPPLLRFAHVGAEAGLDFRYFNGTDPRSGRAYMFEFNGGGVCVLDYDNDGWPDLYFTQGCRWPVNPTDTSHRDRLFRNRGDGRFMDVTEEAGLGDTGFSCGATAGDFDNDGWPDLYVANIGENRFYRNLGDGTFRDVTVETGTAGGEWSMGAAFGDFNDDGLPDLYVVNYLAGPEVFDRSCFDGGVPVQCGPTLFRGEQDRVYTNLGDGRFADSTLSAGIVAPDGKGLGVVVADFDNSGRLGVYVANDTTANFLFRNPAGERGRPLRLVDEALLAGAAFDEHGRAQASMGIAIDDANGDGRLDLFVTNFYREPNALYVQTKDGRFEDAIRSAGMHGPSFEQMGWGTQFLDADLDGRPDLVLVNGHVNDFRRSGIPYEMPAQFFWNAGGGRFLEADAKELGPYFAERHLGRALARLDWNRDGRDDFCATHIDAPPALIENQVAAAGNFLSIRLVGVTGERDATGTWLEVTAGGQRWQRQLTAGDGFAASNEKLVRFGLSDARRVDRLIVRWRGGPQQVFTDLPVNSRCTVVEGRPEPIFGPP